VQATPETPTKYVLQQRQSDANSSKNDTDKYPKELLREGFYQVFPRQHHKYLL